MASILRTHVARWLGSASLYWLALLGLCAAYLQGGFNKLTDFAGAVAEMQHFGLQPAAPLAAAVIALELGAAVLILAGRLRWLGALALAAFTLGATLVANRYWDAPPEARFGLANAFYEHLGLVGGFVLVACQDVRARAQRTPA
jgi:uncharacterized membrane protein YphA (DoxX/SURF4 family)